MFAPASKSNWAISGVLARQSANSSPRGSSPNWIGAAFQQQFHHARGPAPRGGLVMASQPARPVFDCGPAPSSRRISGRSSRSAASDQALRCPCIPAGKIPCPGATRAFRGPWLATEPRRFPRSGEMPVCGSSLRSRRGHRVRPPVEDATSGLQLRWPRRGANRVAEGTEERAWPWPRPTSQRSFFFSKSG